MFFRIFSKYYLYSKRVFRVKCYLSHIAGPEINRFPQSFFLKFFCGRFNIIHLYYNSCYPLSILLNVTGKKAVVPVRLYQLEFGGAVCTPDLQFLACADNIKLDIQLIFKKFFRFIEIFNSNYNPVKILKHRLSPVLINY